MKIARVAPLWKSVLPDRLRLLWTTVLWWGERISFGWLHFLGSQFFRTSCRCCERSRWCTGSSRCSSRCRIHNIVFMQCISHTMRNLVANFYSRGFPMQVVAFSQKKSCPIGTQLINDLSNQSRLFEFLARISIIGNMRLNDLAHANIARMISKWLTC